MLGQKRNKEEEGLHSDETLLEYQNKCLINKVREQKEEISSSKSQLDLLKSQSNFLSKAFMEVNCRLLSMVDALTILMCEMGIEPVEKTSNCNSNEGEKEKERNFLEIGLEILSTLRGDFTLKEQLTHQHASMIDNIKNNIETIVDNLISGLRGKPNKDISNHSSVSGLKKKFESLKKELDLKNQELSILSYEKIDYTSSLKEKDKEINELNSKLSNLNRKSICNPLIPYLRYSKDLFYSVKPEHSCICHVCGEEFQNLTNHMPIQNYNSYNSDNISKVNSQVLMPTPVNNLDENSMNVNFLILNFLILFIN